MTVKRKITTAGNSAALVLSQDLLGLMEIGVGDEVEMTMVDRTLVVRPVVKANRDRRVAAAVDTVFADHAELLRRLAGGAAASTPKARAPRRRARRSP